jgi:tRNA(Arg) A34 adenosine deaminase TadA
MHRPSFKLQLPEWFEEYRSRSAHAALTLADRMRLVIELSSLNIRNGTGGPFAAGIFLMDEGTLLAPGVNLVVWGGSSVFHAEIVALIGAQHKAGVFDLSSPALSPCELVTSTEPCAMCLGAIQWAGIRRLVCGARGSDAEAIGFDEGEKPQAWTEALKRRGILVERDVCRDEAVAVLKEYRTNGGIVYNAASNKKAQQ